MLNLQVAGCKESVSTDTETPFMFADVTDYLLDVSDMRTVNILPPTSGASSSHTAPQHDERTLGHTHAEQQQQLSHTCTDQMGHTRGDVAVVSDAFMTQRMSQLADD